MRSGRSSVDDRPRLKAMAEVLVSDDSLSMTAAARLVLELDGESNRRSETISLENRAKRLARKYSKQRSRLETVARRERKVAIGRAWQEKRRQLGFVVYFDRLLMPRVPIGRTSDVTVRNREKVAKEDLKELASSVEAIIKTLSGWVDPIKEKKTLSSAQAFVAGMAHDLETAAAFLREQIKKS